MAGNFLQTIFDSVKYSQKEWLLWSNEIGNDFLKVMALQQICLGVHINRGKTKPTEGDKEFYSNVSIAKLDAIMQKLEERASIIDRDWHIEQLPQDVDREIADHGQSNQDIANGVYKILKGKYNYNFGVTVQYDADTIVYLINGLQYTTVRKRGLTITVSWYPPVIGNESSSTVDHINKLLSKYNCSEGDRDIKDTLRPQDTGLKLLDYIVSRDKHYFNSKNFDLIYVMVTPIPTGRYGSNSVTLDGRYGYKSDHGNTFLFPFNKCSFYYSQYNCYGMFCAGCQLSCGYHYTTEFFGMYAYFGFHS